MPDLDALFDGYVFEHKDTRPLSTAPTVLQPCHLCGYDGSAFERLYQDLQNVDSHGAEIVRCPECAMVIMRPRVRDLGYDLAFRKGLVRAPPPETIFLHRKLVGAFL
ncbi:MAG TPA: hypothetical protein PKE00_10110, partial [Planctomycetota bacterium]|nr:hypothetical protein [Planctomycetota bacterium]